MTVSSPNVIEIKLDRVIDDMRLLRSQMIAFDMHLKGIEASLKASEPSEQQPKSKSRPWFAAAAIATARTVLILLGVGAATGAALLYLGKWPHNGTAICALMGTRPSVMGPLMSTVPRSSRRRAHASVRGRRRGRHTMLSEGAVSLSRYAWFVG